MASFPILSMLLALPFVGALVLLLFCRNGTQVAHEHAGHGHGCSHVAGLSSKSIALAVSTITFVVSLLLLTHFNMHTAAFQYEERFEWFKDANIHYYLGIDGISIYFVLLTTLLIPVCILASWKSITYRVREFMIAFLVMETFVIGVFVSLDFVLFYVFFEAVLIPMYFIIGIWGSKNRVYAAYKFFLYTLAGSLLLLVALVYIYLKTGTTDIVELMGLVPQFSKDVQIWLWLAFFASFAVKVPMVPFHTWLPDAHVQAPTAGSVILAGVLLKLGGYGFIRLSLPLLPAASVALAPYINGLSIIAVIYTSLVALMQTDMKKLIAYSSIAHMGFVTIGIFALTQQAIEGAVFQMLSHGIVSAALFLIVGVVYDRMHTREIARFGGLVERMPAYALMFMVFTMASIGLPSTSGFVGEVLVMAGVFKVSPINTFLIGTGVILGAAYMLWLYARVVFGKMKHDDLKDISDLDCREYGYLVTLAAMAIVFGIYPKPILEPLHASVNYVIQQVHDAVEAPQTAQASVPAAPGQPSLKRN
ncbi:MAG: NADH-quinone oxidoreductase subunit M [Alphaproteobacteria bacterium]|nr:NADH-quinone oxidoreductase subunit M [Alphaproteobacteria bacterium]